MEIVMAGLEFLRRFLQRIGPYFLVELLLPGGSLLALALFLYRRRRPARLQKTGGDQVYGRWSTALPSFDYKQGLCSAER